MSDEVTDERSDFFPQYKRQVYVPVFRLPQTERWIIDADWREGYYKASRCAIKGVASGELRDDIEGVPGVFLFRHYLELALKLIIFHARWLKDGLRNARSDEIEAVNKTHSLRELWQMAQATCKGKIPQSVWRSWDIDFLAACADEFNKIDPHPGWRFRYPGEKLQVSDPSAPRPGHLWINFHALLGQMEHAYDVLWEIDSYLLNTYGENVEWEPYPNSL